MNVSRLTWTVLQMILLLGLGSCKKDKTIPSSNVDNNVMPADFLSGSNYSKLVVEIQSMPGMQPAAATMDNLKAFLEQRLNKPGGVQIVQSSVPPSKSVYSIFDIEAIESANRTQHTQAGTLTAYILFVNGSYNLNSGNSKVLGVTYKPSSMVIFDQTIKEYSGGLTQPSVETLESSVSEHEFGHILGLVNNGSAMQTAHQDTPHGKHCTNTNCLMYWSAETSDVVGNVLGNNIPVLDANCISDLQANGGK
ncbi:MAG: peptidase [Bacteroidia bacterium]